MISEKEMKPFNPEDLANLFGRPLNIVPDILIVPCDWIDYSMRLLQARIVKWVGRHTLWQYEDEKPEWSVHKLEWPKRKMEIADVVRDCAVGPCPFYRLPRAMRRHGFWVDSDSGVVSKNKHKEEDDR